MLGPLDELTAYTMNIFMPGNIVFTEINFDIIQPLQL